jgi:lipocalin
MVYFYIDWIMQLGPAIWGPDNLYAYSLVSEPNGLYLFVLARDVADYYVRYFTIVIPV